MTALRAIALIAQFTLIPYSAYIFVMALGALRRLRSLKGKPTYREPPEEYLQAESNPLCRSNLEYAYVAFAFRGGEVAA